MFNSTIGGLLDIESLQARLSELGVSESVLASRARQFASAAEALKERGATVSDSAVAFFVPGRIEVLGKHTDYAGGKSVVCAVDRGFAIIALPLEGPKISLTNVAQGEDVTFDFHPDLIAKHGHWSNYPMTVARRVARNFGPELRGAKIAFLSDLPIASGLSSSSAMVVGFFSVLSAINELPKRPLYQEVITDKLSLAEYLGTTENGQSYRKFAGDRGVGTFGGSEDHTAILCSEPDKLKCFRYAPTTFVREVPIPEGYVFVIGSSGVQAEKTGGAQQWYNDVATLAADAAATWRKGTGTEDANLARAIGNPTFTVERMVEILKSHEDRTWGSRLVQRFQHFYEEDQIIIPAALNALETSDVAAFGRAVKDSQAGAENLLGNQIDETKALVRMALDCDAVATSAFGAGFGGSVWALVRAIDAEKMRDQWAAVYQRQFPEHRDHSVFFVSTNGPATVQL